MVVEITKIVLLGDGLLALRVAHVLRALAQQAVRITEAAAKLDGLAHHDRHRLQRRRRRGGNTVDNFAAAKHVEQRGRVQPLVLRAQSRVHERLVHLVPELRTPVGHRDGTLDAFKLPVAQVGRPVHRRRLIAQRLPLVLNVVFLWFSTLHVKLQGLAVIVGHVHVDAVRPLFHVRADSCERPQLQAARAFDVVPPRRAHPAHESALAHAVLAGMRARGLVLVRTVARELGVGSWELEVGSWDQLNHTAACLVRTVGS